jgi:hypothetical protein
MNAAYVKATDGLLYRDPVLRGADWYLVIDAADEPELVVAAGGMTPAQAQARAYAILDESGLTAAIASAPRRMMRAFHAGQSRQPAYCFVVEIFAPIPRERLPADAPGFTQPAAGDPVMCFGGRWG